MNLTHSQAAEAPIAFDLGMVTTLKCFTLAALQWRIASAFLG